MGQRLETWQHGSGDRRWLALLVAAMEQASQPEIRAVPCEIETLQALRAQLARPVRILPYKPTPFSLRN